MAAASAANGNGAAAPRLVRPGGGEAVVSFSTKLPDQFQVPEDQLVLPGTLARYGLSEVVNRLLSSEEPVPFDFLIDGEFLRTTVAQYLESHKITAEKVLKLEYVLALSEPKEAKVDEAPDWISGVVALQGLPSAWFAAVSYDGTARIYEGTTSRLCMKLSDSPLVGLSGLSVDGGRGFNLMAASKDGAVRCCNVSLTGSEVSAGPTSLLRGPNTARAASAVAISQDGTLLASGGWDQEVLVWNASGSFAPPVGSKRKAPSSASENAVPKFTLKGHSQVVTALHFGAPERYPYTLLSGSWDSSLRVWDIVAASCVCNWTVARAVTSFSMSPEMPPQVATSHEDGHVSLWDLRAPPHPSVQGAVSLDASAGLPLNSAQAPHQRMASEVKWCPLDANRLASVGHDGRLCILDPRSPKMPIQAIRIGKQGVCPTKLLCVDWLARNELAVGGSDGKVVRITVGSSELAVTE